MTEQSESQATSEDSVERVIGDKGCGIIGKICWALILLAAPPLLVVWALNGGSIGASIFLGIVLVIFIRVYISSEIVDAFHNRRKVDTILKRGGPQTSPSNVVRLVLEEGERFSLETFPGLSEESWSRMMIILEALKTNLVRA